MEETEEERPDYRGTKQVSTINGSEVRHFPLTKKALNMTISASTTFFLACCCISCVIGIYIMRRNLRSELGGSVQILASVLSSLQILVFDLVFCGWLAYVLTGAFIPLREDFPSPLL